MSGLHSAQTDNHRLETWVYADATARGAATGFVSGDVGKVAYQTDTGEYWRLTAVTPTWDQVGGASLASPLTTKGDLWVYSSTDDREPVGANGYALLADSGQATGLRWGPAMVVGAPVSGGTTGHVLYIDGSGNLGDSSALQLGPAALAFFGGGTVSQQSTTGTSGLVSAGMGTNINDATTLDGGLGGNAYTVGDIVLALKNYGLLA